MATVQGPIGKIEIFEDFVGAEVPIALTNAFGNIGSLRVIGDGLAETDSGIVALDSDAVNGVAQFTTTNEDKHAAGVTTSAMFDVGNMGTIVAECRVQFPDLDTKEFYFGLTDENVDAENLEGSTIHGASTTITLTAATLCGFLFSAELTDDEDWHMVYNGGTTTGETDSTNIDADVDAVAAEYDIIRVEVAINGTARWYINGVLKQTVENAVSTTAELAVIAMVETKTATNEYAWIDYIAIEANRDWTE